MNRNAREFSNVNCRVCYTLLSLAYNNMRDKRDRIFQYAKEYGEREFRFSFKYKLYTLQKFIQEGISLILNVEFPGRRSARTRVKCRSHAAGRPTRVSNLPYAAYFARESRCECERVRASERSGHELRLE